MIANNQNRWNLVLVFLPVLYAPLAFVCLWQFDTIAPFVPVILIGVFLVLIVVGIIPLVRLLRWPFYGNVIAGLVYVLLSVLIGPILTLLAGMLTINPSWKTPVFVKEIVLKKGAGLSFEDSFPIKASGHYKIFMEMNRREGIWMSDLRTSNLIGEVDIADANERAKIAGKIDRDLVANQAGLDLVEFDSADIGGKGAKMIKVHLDESGESLARDYEKVTIYIRRVHWTLLD
jgi:hypothetical protein